MLQKQVVSIKTIFGEFKCFFDSNRPEKGYTVTVPKLPGVVSCGDTLTEAKKMTKEAIELHCECLIEERRAELKLRHCNVQDRTKVFA